MNARVVFFIHDISSQCDHAPVKFHEYIPYGLGIMARTCLLYGTKSRADNSKTKMQELSFLFMNIVSK